MSKLLILFFLFSCSGVISKQDARSYYRYVTGPLPEDVSSEDVKKDLSRWGSQSRVGKITLQVLTPPYLYLNIKEQQKLNEYRTAEARQKIKDEINHLVRYESCFLMTLRTHNPVATELRFWQAYVIFSEKDIMPAKIKDVTDVITGSVFGSETSMAEYIKYATVCTQDKLNLKTTYTVVLHPDFRPGIQPMRFTWRRIQQPNIILPKEARYYRVDGRKIELEGPRKGLPYIKGQTGEKVSPRKPYIEAVKPTPTATPEAD